jgi:hypothetical protein
LLDLQGAYYIARPVASGFHNDYRKTYQHSNRYYGSIPSSLLLTFIFHIIFNSYIPHDF